LDNGAEINKLMRARKIVKAGYYFREGFTWTVNKHTFKIVSIKGTGDNRIIKYINVDKPDKKYVTNEKELTFSLYMEKNKKETDKKMAELEAKENEREAEIKRKVDEEHRKQVEGLEGFELTVPVIRRSKVIEVLNRLIRHEGHIKHSKDIIVEKIKAGWVVEQQTWETDRKIKGERVGTKHTRKVLTNGDTSLSYMNKTEIDFAEYLSKKLGKPARKFSLSQLKSSSKLSSRTSKTPLKVSHEPIFKRVEKPSKKIDLKQALGKLKAPEKPVGRGTKIKPDKGISFVFNGIPSMPQKATLIGDNVAVTCYRDGKSLFSYTMKLRDIETAGHFKDTDLLKLLVERKIPDSVKKEYPGYAIDM
jgi:hypothetical protein